MCAVCYEIEYRRQPFHLIDADVETCSSCGARTMAGIYVRRDPRTCKFPTT
jgi:hypothetical protein